MAGGEKGKLRKNWLSMFNDLPYYIQLSLKLLMIFLLGAMIYFGRDIIVPIYFAGLLAILLLPFTQLLERAKIPAPIATFIPVIAALLIIAVIIYYFSVQVTGFVRDVPSLRKHLNDHYLTLQQWLNRRFHVSSSRQTEIFQNITEEIRSSGGQYIGQTFSSLAHTLILTIFVAIYTFLILFYRQILKRFLVSVFRKEYTYRVREVIMESKMMVKHYMFGLLIEMAIVATVNTTMFICIGIKYAVFLGVLSAMLNIIPYVGIFTAMLITVLTTLTTSSEMSDIIWVILSLLTIHFIDSNFLMPRIVGSKVKINALVTITGVVIGGSLLGLSGIFLALPTIAVLKIIFDKIDSLKPWGKLLGDDSSENDTKGHKFRNGWHEGKMYKKLFGTTSPPLQGRT